MKKTKKTCKACKTCSNWSKKYWKFVISELVVGSGVQDETGICFQNCSELLW